MPEIEIGQTWRHKQRGTTYIIVSTSASIQCSAFERSVQITLEDEDWIAYWPTINPVPQAMVFRMREEFLDGRFEFVKDAPE